MRSRRGYADRTDIGQRVRLVGASAKMTSFSVVSQVNKSGKIGGAGPLKVKKAGDQP